jgi:hypothetical protein
LEAMDRFTESKHFEKAYDRLKVDRAYQKADRVAAKTGLSDGSMSQDSSQQQQGKQQNKTGQSKTSHYNPRGIASGQPREGAGRHRMDLPEPERDPDDDSRGVNRNLGSDQRARRRSLPSQGRADSNASSISPRGTQYKASDFTPFGTRGLEGSQRSQTRSSAYAPTEGSRRASQYQLAPYDDEKAYAEWNRAYGPGTAYDQPPPTETGSGRDSRTPRYERRSRYSDDRSDDRKSYDRDGRPYDNLSPDESSPKYDDRRDRRDRRRHSPSEKRRDVPKVPEENIKSALIGGASGAYLGNRLLGKGALGTLGGAIIGAVGVNAIEMLDGKRRDTLLGKGDKDARRRTDDSRRGSRSDRESGYYSQDEYASSVDSRYDDRAPRRSRHQDRPRPSRLRSYSYDG